MPAKAPVISAPGPGIAADGDDALAGLFPREAPLVLDLGCGNGLFLTGLAACEPGWNILGIEKRSSGCGRRGAGRVTSAIPASCMVRCLRCCPPCHRARSRGSICFSATRGPSAVTPCGVWSRRNLSRCCIRAWRPAAHSFLPAIRGNTSLGRGKYWPGAAGG